MIPQPLHTVNVSLNCWKNEKLFSDISTIRDNTDDYAYQYRCATTLYLLSMLAHAYNIIMDFWVGVPVHSREVVDVLS